MISARWRGARSGLMASKSARFWSEEFGKVWKRRLLGRCWIAYATFGFDTQTHTHPPSPSSTPRNYFFSCFIGDIQLLDWVGSVTSRKKILIWSAWEGFLRVTVWGRFFWRKVNLFVLFLPSKTRRSPFSLLFFTQSFRFPLPFSCSSDGEIHPRDSADHQPMVLPEHYHSRSRPPPRYLPSQLRISRYNPRPALPLPTHGTILRRSILRHQQQRQHDRITHHLPGSKQLPFGRSCRRTRRSRVSE